MSGFYSKLLKYLGRESSGDGKLPPSFELAFEPEDDSSYLPVIPASTVALEIKELKEKTVMLEKRMNQSKHAKLNETRRAVEDYEIAHRRLNELVTKCDSVAITLLDVNVTKLAECICFHDHALMMRKRGRFCAADLLDFQRFLAAALTHLILDQLSQAVDQSAVFRLIAAVIKLAQTLLHDYGDLNGFAGVSLAFVHPSVRRLLAGKIPYARALKEFGAILDPSNGYSNYFTRFHSPPRGKPQVVPWFLPFATEIDSLLQLYSDALPTAAPQLSPPAIPLAVEPPLSLAIPTLEGEFAPQSHCARPPTFLSYPGAASYPYRPMEASKGVLFSPAINVTSDNSGSFIGSRNQIVTSDIKRDSSFLAMPLEDMSLDGNSLSEPQRLADSIAVDSNWQTASNTHSLVSGFQQEESASELSNLHTKQSLVESLKELPLLVKPPTPCTTQDIHSFEILELSSPTSQVSSHTSFKPSGILESSPKPNSSTGIELSATSHEPTEPLSSETHGDIFMAPKSNIATEQTTSEISCTYQVNPGIEHPTPFTYIAIGTATFSDDQHVYPVIRVQGIPFTEFAKLLDSDRPLGFYHPEMPIGFSVARDDDRDDQFPTFSYFGSYLKLTKV
ncbi:hypothetical protein L0F63_001654 [Massospora cicadina]|nr:hypothetical protein L0F63_001654 [Massospora cicadina]